MLENSCQITRDIVKEKDDSNIETWKMSGLKIE